ncbi:MAG: hypothetical protein QXQ18_00605 [Candidatus Aenigmatarchaeota archaeon]
MKKAQTEAISLVLIVLLAIGLVAVAYSWGLPLIQKRQDTIIVERVKNSFSQINVNSLPSKIERAANSASEETFNLDVDGLWVLYPYDFSGPENNSISFTFFSKVTDMAPDTGWQSLTPNAQCPPLQGTLAVDKASVVCRRADKFSDGYNITYRIWFRNLTDTRNLQIYRINLLKHEAGYATSTLKTLKIFGSTPVKTTIGSQTLITTEVKILLG